MPTYNGTGQAFQLYGPTGNVILDGVLEGSKWGGTGFGSPVQLSYSFPIDNSLFYSGYGDDEPLNGFVPFNSAQQAATRSVMAMIETFVNVDFVEVVTESAAEVGDFRFGFSSALASTEEARAYAPGGLFNQSSGVGATDPESGDAWIVSSKASSFDTTAGSDDYWLLLHEVAHGLGLKHPFESETNPYGTFPESPGRDTLDLTIMAFDPIPGSGSAFLNYFPTTLMIDDIRALQYLYGANTSHANGNETYRFNQGESYNMTLWDTGGSDTIVWDATTQGGRIDLRPGSWQSLGNALSATSSERTTSQTVFIPTDVSIESAIGGGGDDVLIGNTSQNILRGGAGADTIIGLDGDDILIGEDGADTINGGAGNDTLDAGSGLWADVLVGEAGDDIYELYNASSQVYENSGEGRDTVRSYAWNTTLWENIEDLDLIDPRADTNGTGNALNNVLKGNAGNNQLTGLGGDDIIIGNAGNDILDGGDGSDIINAGDGNDLIFGGSGLWTDVLIGGGGDDIYELYNVASSIYENEGEGRDTVRSYAWTTTLGENLEDLDLIDAHNDTFGTGNAVNNVIKAYGGNNRLWGLAGDDTLIGNGGNDYLDGGDGSDTLNGGEGNDFLAAGSGLWTDVLVGGTGDDTYEIYNAACQIYENGGEGTDTVKSYAWITTLASNVENLELTDPGSNTDGIGNALDNVITGNAGGNRLQGLAGNDTLSGGDGSDRLEGGAGNDNLYAGSGLWTDILIGGAGDDGYILYNSASTITENAGEGTDVVLSYAWATTLAANVENLLLVDLSSNTDGTGNALANTIIGNAGSNRLVGLGGNDLLIGGAGADTLEGNDGSDTLRGGTGADRVTGGAGVDSFEFNSADAMDTVTDFVAGSGGDKLDIRDILSGYQPGSSSIGDFVRLAEAGGSTTMSVNSDGIGTDFVSVALLTGVTGLNLNALLNDGNLVAA